MRGPLPVYVEDPVKRLEIVRAAMDDLKDSKQALGRRGDLALQRLRAADPARAGLADQLLDPALQPDRHQRPGPQIPLYVLGRELQDVFPVAFLPENHALAIAIMSYNGGINFGLLADYDSMEDVDLIADGAHAPRSTSCSRRPRRSRRAPRRTSPPAPTCPASGSASSFDAEPGVRPSRRGLVVARLVHRDE